MDTQVLAERLEAIEAKLDATEAKLNSTEAKLDAILAHLQGTSDGVARMNGHIDFVEGVYDTLRHPLSRLTGLVRRRELPEPPARTVTDSPTE